MGTDLEKAIMNLTLRMRLLKAVQEEKASSDTLSEREALILGLLGERGKMSISEIAASEPSASDSTISTTITRLWRNKKMVSKTINPQNQRVTIVELTEKGKKAIESLNEQRSERFRALFKAIGVTNEEEEILIRTTKRAVQFFDKFLGLDGNKKE